MDVEAIKKMNADKNLIKKYNAFLAFEATIRKLLCLLGPGLNMTGKLLCLSYISYLCISWVIYFLTSHGLDYEQTFFCLRWLCYPWLHTGMLAAARLFYWLHVCGGARLHGCGPVTLVCTRSEGPVGPSRQAARSWATSQSLLGSSSASASKGISFVVLEPAGLIKNICCAWFLVCIWPAW
jgi:hypothetical protein